MPPGSPDAADAARCRPPSDRLRVYSEERSHLTRCEKALIVAIHGSPPPISVSERVFSVAKTSVYFLVFPKNRPLVSLVSFGFGRPPRCVAVAIRVCRPISPAVHGKWRDVSARRPGVAECAAHDYGMCKALLSAGCDFRSSPIAERAALIGFPAIPASRVAHDAERYEPRESPAPAGHIPGLVPVAGQSPGHQFRDQGQSAPVRGGGVARVGWMSDSRRRRRCWRRCSRALHRGDR